jgi:hypothetical protein
MREIESFIGRIWQFLEELFETIQQIKSRKYAFLNAKRFLGYPVKGLNIGTALVWTAYGRVGGNQQILALAGVYSGQLRGWFGWKRRIFFTSFYPQGSIPYSPKTQSDMADIRGRLSCRGRITGWLLVQAQGKPVISGGIENRLNG